jgi:hypothetical protein
MAEKPSLGYKDFERLVKSIGCFREEEGEDTLRLFSSWVQQFFTFYVDLTIEDFKVPEHEAFYQVFAGRITVTAREFCSLTANSRFFDRCTYHEN